MPWRDMEEDEIKADEGLRHMGYLDTVGVATAGYGHTGKDVKVGEAYSQQKIDDWFETDFEEAITEAKRVVSFFDALDGPRKGAIVNLAFNMGGTKLAEFHGMLAALDEGDWTTAALHLMNSRYARQTKSRAVRLAYRLRTGEYAVRT